MDLNVHLIVFSSGCLSPINDQLAHYAVVPTKETKGNEGDGYPGSWKAFIGA